ncbi:unnamed protein product [Strongylus vulgaris]|uniref:Uncharacterized protein n=1 Tax=Strongylus vulgaris TaxID=40348 RepID=A0A3P7JIA3_STRVU|nr:unnamed protein product [Strongylus vulgaris]
MAPSVYTISFILEKIHRAYAENFFLSLRFEEHDWCRVGEFDDEDLPIGFMFTTVLSSFNNADKFKMEINVSNRTSFLACLQFSKIIGAEVLSTRGLSVLYPKDNDQSVMAVTIAVKVVRYYYSPTLEKIVTRDDEAQTDRIEMKTAQTQVQPYCTSTGSNTELHLLSEAELENTVATVVAQHLDSIKEGEVKKTEQRSAIKSLDALPDHISRSQTQRDLDLGKNVVPRLQKLRVLDKMIGERTAVVEQFDENKAATSGAVESKCKA